MSRPKTTTPEMFWWAAGKCYAVNLGPNDRRRLGKDKAKAEEKYRRLIGEWLLRGQAPAPAPTPTGTSTAAPVPGGLTVSEALLAYCKHVRDRVSPGQYARIEAACDGADELYGSRPVEDFNQLALQAVRNHLLKRPSRRVREGKAGAKMRELLNNGPMASAELEKAMVGAGFCVATYRNARSALKVKSWKEGKRWLTALGPAKAPPEGKPLSRNYVNRLIGCLQTAWQWLVSQMLAPNGSDLALRSVKALREDEGGVEVPLVMPVAPETVEATLPSLTPTVRAMVRVQQLTGMRPGEVCRMRGCEISRASDQFIDVPIRGKKPVRVSAVQAGGVLVWLYAPCKHKTSKKGKPRVIALGPKAQAELAPFLENRAPEAYLFSPAEASAAWRAAKGRKAKYGRARQPKERYTTQSYGVAVERAAARAGVEHWQPNQLRHSMATDLVEKQGQDHHDAAAVLGHAHADTTVHYVGVVVKKAAEAMAEAG